MQDYSLEESVNPYLIGHVWTCGAVESVLTIGLHNVFAIAFGKEHCLFLTSERRLFAFGRGSYGQLGQGTQIEHPKEPQQVLGIEGKICSIACGPWNSGAVCTDGSVYMWGCNDFGQCGVTGDIVLRPALVKTKSSLVSCHSCESPLHKKVHMVHISCGDRHTLGLTRDHELWVWGSGIQLGLTNILQSTPTPIEYLRGRRVISFSCGSNYSLAVVEAVKELNLKGACTQVQFCPKCKGDEITVTETDDAVIISQDHICPLGLPVTDGGKPDVENSPELNQSNARPANNDAVFDNNSPVPPDLDYSKNDKRPDLCCNIIENTQYEEEVADTSGTEHFADQSISTNSEITPIKLEANTQEMSSSRETDEFQKLLDIVSYNSALVSESSESTNDVASFSVPPTVPEDNVQTLNANIKQENFRKRSQSEAVVLRDNNALKTSSRAIIKRTKSLIDPNTAREFYEKLVGLPSPQPIAEHPEPSSADSNRVAPFVWDIVSRVKSSVDKISLPSFVRTDSKLEEQAGELHSSSQESFEVVESDCIEMEEMVDESSLKRCESLKLLLEVKRNQKTKALLRNSSFDANMYRVHEKQKRVLQTCRREQHKHSVIQTEVWSWGAGDYFQLGHSDSLERSQPCCIQQLSGQGVMMVLAGANHSIALTRDSRVYTWGRNDKGQLGHSLSNDVVSSPKLIEFPHRELVWDIAAGEAHTVFLVDNRAPRVALYYCGNHENVETCTCNKVKGLRQLNILKKSGLMVRVFAGGPYGGCIVNQHGLSELPILHEFSATERWFLFQLQTVLTEIMTPVLKDESLPGDMSSARYEPLKSLIGQMAHLTEMVAVNTHDLTLTVLNKSHLGSVYMLEHQEEWLECYLLYTQCLCDAISVGVPTALTKSWRLSPNILKMLARDTLGEVGLDQKSSAEIFLHLANLPLRRAREYARLLNHISTSNHKRVSAVDIQKSSSLWQQLVDVVAWDVQLAEKTKQFWDVASHRLVEAFMTSSRRLIRDSKKHPIHLQSSGRFAAHHFILFNDLLVHTHFSSMQNFPLQTVWVEPLPDSDSIENAFVLTMPEDTMMLTCSTSSQKTEWVCALNLAIRQSLGMDRDLMSRLRSNSGNRRLSPPLPRQASYTLTKGTHFKDAKYTGSWLCGKLHGQGEMVWPDGRKYVGKFKQNFEDGEGVLTVPHGGKVCVYDGIWKDGKMHGHGIIKYPNGDSYEGNFSHGQKHGHGMFKQGQLLSSAAHIYIGSWLHNQKNGYGVLDNVHIGEKYLGMWENDCRQGPGIVVTIDGIYYKGSFVLDKLSGFGIMVFEDGTRYEGELGPEGTLSGKGCLYLSNKDTIEGSFSGKWSDGIKLSGVFHKSTSCDLDSKTPSSGFKATPIPTSCKWEDLFKGCYELLGIQGLDRNQDNKRAWDAIAVSLAKRRRRKESKTKRRWRSFHKDGVDILERLPEVGSCQSALSLKDYREIQLYLSKACDCLDHPLGQLVENIVDVYRASYLGVGAHPKLLTHAAAEIQSFISRTYKIIRVLFLNLPLEGSPVVIPTDSDDSSISDSLDELDNHLDVEIVTPSALLHPILMPRLYPPLFTLYALHNEKEDELYWKRLLKWNRQSDIALMTFLGVNPKMWLMHISSNMISDAGKRLSTMKEKHFSKAVDTLQHISTSFTPMEKLHTIHRAFDEINKEVQSNLKQDFIWTMDDLFPAFQYVVVRAQIQHLGAEIHFVDNLMENHFELGELGIMFTTLKACYFQIRTEKVQQM